MFIEQFYILLIIACEAAFHLASVPGPCSCARRNGEKRGKAEEKRDRQEHFDRKLANIF